MSLITAEMSASYYERLGRIAGEDRDDEVVRCPECRLPTEEELVWLDDQLVCDACHGALTTEDAA